MPTLNHRLDATFCTAVLAALLASGPATAQPDASASAIQARVSHADRTFLKLAAQSGVAEVEGSKLAETKGESAPVKAFARQMVTDHAAVGEELAALAALKGVEVPDRPSVAQKGKIKWLNALEGAGFDRRYLDNFGVKAHEDTVKLFENAARDTRDSEIRAFAVKTLPGLKHHLETARELKASNGAR